MNGTEQVATVINGIAEHTLDYALLLAAIGTLSMAFLEVLKGLLALRRRFNRKQVNCWVSSSQARHELLVLAAGGEQNADVLFDQPIEKMMGQIQAAANLALEFPDRYHNIYEFFTKEDLDEGAGSDSERWHTYAKSAAKTGVSPNADSDTRSAQQARVRLGNLTSRRLDTFQNRSQYLWARYNQFASIILGAGLSLFALTRTTTLENPRDYVALIGLSLLAGMLAPFAKDVVAAVSSIRTKA